MHLRLFTFKGNQLSQFPLKPLLALNHGKEESLRENCESWFLSREKAAAVPLRKENLVYNQWIFTKQGNYMTKQYLLFLLIFLSLQCKTKPQTPKITKTDSLPEINQKTSSIVSDLIPDKPLQDPQNFPAPELKISTLETDLGPLAMVEVVSQTAGDYTQISICSDDGKCLDSDVSFKKRTFPIPSQNYTVKASSCVNPERSLNLTVMCGGVASVTQSYRNGFNPSRLLTLTAIFLLTEKMRTKAYSVIDSLRAYKNKTYQKNDPLNPFDVKVENELRMGAPVIGDLLSSSMFSESFALLPKKTKESNGMSLASLQNELKKMTAQLTALETVKPSDAGQKIAELQSQINDIKTKTQDTAETDLQQKLANLEKTVKALSTNNDDTDYKKQLKEMKESLSSLQKANKDDNLQQQDIEALRKEISDLKEANKNPKVDTSKVDALSEKIKTLEAKKDNTGIGAGGSLLISFGTIPVLLGAVTLGAGYYLGAQKLWLTGVVKSNLITGQRLFVSNFAHLISPADLKAIGSAQRAIMVEKDPALAEIFTALDSAEDVDKAITEAQKKIAITALPDEEITRLYEPLLARLPEATQKQVGELFGKVGAQIDSVRTNVFDIVDSILLSYDYPAMTDESFKLLTKEEQLKFRKIGSYYFRTEGAIPLDAEIFQEIEPDSIRPGEPLKPIEVSMSEEEFLKLKQTIEASEITEKAAILRDLETNFPKPEHGGRYVQVKDPKVASRFFFEDGKLKYVTSSVETTKSIPRFSEETLQRLAHASANATPGLRDPLSDSFKAGNQWEKAVPLIVEKPGVDVSAPAGKKFALLEPPDAMKNPGVNWFKDGEPTLKLRVGGKDITFVNSAATAEALGRVDRAILDEAGTTLSSSTFKGFEFNSYLHQLDEAITRLPNGGFTYGTRVGVSYPNGLTRFEKGMVPASLIEKVDLVSTTLYKQFLNTAVINHNLKLQTQGLTETARAKALTTIDEPLKNFAKLMKEVNPGELEKTTARSVDNIASKLKKGGGVVLAVGAGLIIAGAATDYFNLADDAQAKLLLDLSVLEEEVMKLDGERKALIDNFDPNQDQWIYML